MRVLSRCDDGVTVLHVGGPVEAADAPALTGAVCSALSASADGVVLDLAHAWPVDPAAVRALREVTSDPAAVALVGAPAELAALPAHADVPHAVQALRTRPGCHEVLVEHGARGPAQARAAVSAWAREAGVERLGDDLALVVSELVTNAVRYGAAPVRVAVAADDDTVTVTVADGDPRRPAPRDADADAEGGRGLLLIDLLAADHGVRDEPPGKAVWAALRRP